MSPPSVYGGVLSYTRSGLQLAFTSPSLLCTPFGYVHTRFDLVYISPSFHLVSFISPLYPFVYVLPVPRSVLLSVVPIIPTESKPTLYRLPITSFSYYLYYSCVNYYRFVYCNSVVPIIPTETVLTTIGYGPRRRLR